MRHVILGLIILVAPGWAAELDAFGPLLGHWEGPGTFFGKPATARYHWERGLGGKFVILRYQALRDGQTLFEGHGYYRANGTGTWHDSQGNLYAIAWKAATGGVDSAWGPGTSEYRVSAEGEFTAIDQAQAKTFATFRLRRQPSASVNRITGGAESLETMAVASKQGIDIALPVVAEPRRGRTAWAADEGG